MRYFDTPSKIGLLFKTLIVGVIALLIAYEYNDNFHWTIFFLVGLACYIVALWISYAWERTWSQEWNNLDKQLEEIRDKLNELEEMLRLMQK